MATSSHLNRVLEDSELLSLPDEVKEKVEKRLNDLHEEIDEWDSKYLRLRVSSEQQCFELEKQLITSNSKLETEKNSAVDLRLKLDELEQKYNDTSQKLKVIEEAQQKWESKELSLTRERDQLEVEKKDLSEVLERKTKEIDRLNDDWKSMSEQLSNANTAKIKALNDLDQIQAEDITRQHREKRTEQEKNQLEQQVQWLNNELSAKTTELMNVKKERSNKLLELQTLVDQKSDQVSHLEETLENTRKVSSEQATRIESLIEKLKNTRDNQALMDEQFRNEIAAQTKLVSLYKISADEAEKKVGELTTAVEELQKLLKQASEDHTELENIRKTDSVKFEDCLKEKDEVISKLERELVDANDLLKKQGALSEEEVEALAPTAAAASKLLKSGKTLTQIYSEYAAATDALMLEKQENERLSQYLDQIVKEIEEKAPVLKRQREDYEQLLQSNSQMTRQLEAALVEHEKLRVDADDKTRRASQVTRENARLKQQTFDLGQQVRMLLKELEELKGNYVSTEHDEANISSSEVSSSSMLISEKLVTFKSIEECQEQNQKLLEVVRDLSEKLEEEERTATNEKTAELQKQLDAAVQELEEMRSARIRQQDMVDSIVRQRDMYRVLAQNSSTAESPLPLSQTSTPFPTSRQTSMIQSPGADQTKQIEETKAALKELQAEYDTYKKERKENERMLNEQLDTFRQELSEYRVQNAKLASQLDFSAERFKVLQSNVESYKKEINALREKNQKYTASIVKHEQTINTLREDLMVSQENASRAEVKCQSLQAEKDLLKSSESRLVQEKESMMREQRTQSILMTNLQTIQNNLERQEFERKTKASNQLESLEKECTLLRRKVEQLQDDHRVDMKAWEHHRKQLQNKYENEMTNHQKTRTQLEDSYGDLHQLKQELSQTEAKLGAAEIRLSKLGSVDVPDTAGPSKESLQTSASADSEDVKDLKTQLQHAKNEIKGLKDQLEKSDQHAQKYKSIADSVEISLKEQNEASQQFKGSLEMLLDEEKQKSTRLEKQVESLDKERQELLNENIKINEDSHKLNAELRKQLTTLQNELQESVQRQEAAIANEQTARRDCQDQAKVAEEAQSKYEHELILHAQDVESLAAVKKQLEGFNERLTSAQEDAKVAQETLQLSQTSWAEQEKIMKEECAKMEERCREIESQNNLLHEQLGTLSGQAIAIQSRAEGASADVSFGEDSSKTSEQLLEVIKFLRKEKAIAATKFEVAQAESSRIKQQVEYLERNLEEANKTLGEEREKAMVSAEAATQHAELMRKVENLNLLTESNKMLREEKERLTTQLKETEIKAKKLEDDALPLKEAQRDLTAQKDVLQAEKTALYGEVERWKVRTNNLIEQTNKADPEEKKKMIQEKEAIRKQLTTVTEETHKQRTEISRLNTSLTTTQNELRSSREQIQKLVKDINSTRAETNTLKTETSTLKADVEAKTRDTEEKAKTIVQLKKIGRKYKQQAEDLQKEYDEFKAKVGQEKQTTGAAAAEEKLKATEEKLKTAEQGMKEANEKLVAMEKETSDLEARSKEIESANNSLNEHIQKMEEALKNLKESESKLKEEKAEIDKKQTQSRNILQTAKAKLTSQKTEIEEFKKEIEKLNSENAELKQRLSGMESSTEESDLRLTSLQSQYTSKIERLERELDEARAGVPSDGQADRLQKENAELQQKVQQLQKQLESSQKQPSTQQRAVKPTTSTGPVDRNSAGQVEPPTANIQPRPVRIQPVATSAPAKASVAPVSTTAAAKATASIRPMAIAPVSSPAGGSSQTPTATVMPVTHPEAHDEEPSGTGVGQLAAQVRPTQQVNPVSPRVEEVQGTEPEVDVSVEQAEEALVLIEQPSTSSTQAVVVPAKRQREEEAESHEVFEGEEEPPEVKRSRVSPDLTEQEQIVQGGVDIIDEPVIVSNIESIQPSTEETQESRVEETENVERLPESQVIETIENEAGTETISSQVLVEETGETEEETIQSGPEKEQSVLESVLIQQEEDVPVQETVQSEPSLSAQPDEDYDVIVVDSDEENVEEEPATEEYEYEEGVEEEEEEYDMDEFEGEGSYDEEHGEYQEEMEEEDEEGDEDMQHEVDDDDDDDDVVIVDDDDDNEAETPETGGQTTVEQQQTIPQVSQAAPQLLTVNPPSMLRPVPGRTERLPSVGRAPFPPFSLGGQAPGFDEGDDCMVPSTPTLLVPKRNDAFAEVVSSPMISQGRFVFGSGELQQSELGQLASQGALGMDDTRMDLSQFDEKGVGSVPSTPHAVAPPITITPADAPSQESQSDSTTQEQTLEGSSGNTTQEQTLEGISEVREEGATDEDVVRTEPVEVPAGDSEEFTAGAEEEGEETLEGDGGDDDIESDLLAGEQGDEDEPSAQIGEGQQGETPTDHCEGTSRSQPSEEASGVETGETKTDTQDQGASKPRIQRITWGTPGQPRQHSQQFSQQQRRINVRGGQRGGQTFRGGAPNRGPSRGGGQFMRGQGMPHRAPRSTRGGRGLLRRPNQF